MTRTIKTFILLCLLLLGAIGGAGAASFTVTPGAFSVSRSQLVTATGTGTAWVSGTTTFNVSGGIAPAITGLTIVSATQATFTLAPGPSVGTLTVSDSADAATASITVASSVTLSGTNLTSWTAGPTYVFDPANEFTASALGHTIIISGGTGFTAGTYTIGAFAAAQNMGGQGTHNIVNIFQLGSTTVGAATGAASGASWSYLMGAGGSGLAGFNLTPWAKSNQYYFDPDVPLASSLNGTTITISGGTGFAHPGTYTVTNYLPAYNTGDQGNQNLISLSPISTFYPAASGDYGANWSKAGGDTIPTATVNSTYTKAIKVLLIGDSITQRQVGTTLTALQAQYPNALSVTVANQGQSGTTTASWLPTDTATETAAGNINTNLFYTAVAVANAAGDTVANIMLGTNDAKATGTTLNITPATHQSNIQAIVTGLRSNVSTLKGVVLNEQPYVVLGTSGWSSDSTSNTALQSYYSGYASISGGTQGYSSSTLATETNYTYFSRNPQALVDGVHPTTSGIAEVNYTWLTSMAALVTATATTPPATYPGSFAKGTISVQLTWLGVTGADHYRLYRDSSLLYDSVNAAGINTDLAYTDSPPISSSHTYQVSAYNTYGEGAKSALVSYSSALSAFGGQLKRGR